MSKMDNNQLLNQFLSGLVIPSIQRVQMCIISADYYSALRAAEILLGVLWSQEDPIVKKHRASIQEVRDKANTTQGVDTESTIRDYAVRRQIIAEPVAVNLYFLIMGRVLSEGFFSFITGVLATSIILKSGDKKLTPISEELSNAVES